MYQSYAGPPSYTQHQVVFTRRMQRDFNTKWQVVAATDDGTVAVGHGYKVDVDDSIDEGEVRRQLKRTLAATRDFILDLGGHGDLRIAWRFLLPDSRVLSVGDQATRGEIDAIVERPATLEADARRDETLVADLIAEVARAGGVGPRDDRA